MNEEGAIFFSFLFSALHFLFILFLFLFLSFILFYLVSNNN
jgi:hypothetical protein